MALFRSDTTRRRELRKTIPRQVPRFRQVFSRAQVLWAAVFVLTYVVLAGWITWESRYQPGYRTGQVVDRAQVARVMFTARDIKATEQAREKARGDVPTIYVPNNQFFEEARVALVTLPDVATAAPSLDKVADDIRTRFGLDEATLTELRQFQQGEVVSPQWVESIDALLNELRRRPIVPTERFQLEKQNLTRMVRLKTPEADLQIDEGEMVNLADAEQIRKTVKDLAGRTGNEKREPLSEALRPVIANYFVTAGQPTYQFDKEATEAQRAAMAAAVEDVLIHYEPDQVIVPAGTVLSEDGHRLLLSEQRAYLGTMYYTSLPNWAAMRFGPFGLIALMALALAATAWAMRPRVGQNPMRGLALTAVLLLTLGAAALLETIGPHATPAAAVFPAVLVAVILTIAYEPRFAVAVVALHSVVIGVALDLSLGIYLVMVAGSLTAAAQVWEIRQRGTLIRAGFVSALVVGFGVFAAAFAERQMVEGIYGAIAAEAALAAIGALAVGFLVLGVLPSIEKVFKVTTAMTLLELCDVNQPLLRRLAQSAPGTYNHSLMVGTLAENAAEAIAANGLLARVGAYYHDIGKVNKPQYFVENRVGGINLHDKLSPAMSLLIIVGHVKDGIEMARELDLPRVLHHFIESHHGTTLVEYFYHEAKKQRPESDQPEEIEYRYPGPKPHTKEAAILMISDAVESASRTMTEPTATRIEQLVHKIASRRLADGQFDECDITLAELHQVEQSLTKSLASIYHGRIAYPAARDERRPSAGPAPAAAAPAVKDAGRVAG